MALSESSCPRDPSAAEAENKAKAMWDVLNNRNTGYEFERSDDDDSSILSMESVEKNQFAVPPEDFTVENSLSEELMKLSLNDRTAIEEEIHGVANETEESHELLTLCLRKFDKELMRVKIRRQQKSRDVDVLRNVIRTTADHFEDEGEDKTASTTGTHSVTPSHEPSNIDTAIQMNAEHESKKSCYVNDPSIRLRFVRAERYDCKRAVKRFVNFLEFGQELYGNFIADRPIRLSDLKTREEKRALANVSFHFLPFRDRSGRRVFVSVGSCGYDIEPVLRCKVLWYMYWIASEDAESQRKGVVVVGWPWDGMISNKIGQSDDEVKSDSDGGGSNSAESNYNVWGATLRPKNVERIYQLKALDGLPIRIATVHVCFQDRPVYRMMNTMFHFAMNSYLKARYKVHIGEPLEIRYKLQGYGIPVDTLPLTHTMTLKRQNHLQWISFRKYVEQHEHGNEGKTENSKPGKVPPIDPDHLVWCPRSHDVIIGKAKYRNNPGNVFYRSLIEATHDEHIASSKRSKVELTWKVVRQIEEQNGRFLELHKSLKVWVHIRDRNIMRQKVAQSYKEYKRNVAVLRSKRQSTQVDSLSTSKLSSKRQKTFLPTIFEKDCFSGCISGFNFDDKTNSNVEGTGTGSESIFQSM